MCQRKINRSLFLAALIAVAITTSCKNNGGGDHLPPKVMQKVLLDISIAESYSTVVKDSTHKQGGKNIDSLTAFYKDIFAHHHITEEQFTESLDWYKSNPTELDSMYTALLPIATKWQSALPIAVPKGGPAINVRP